MLYLPQVTLCINDTRNHELARLALEDSIRDIEFGEILVISDQPFQLSKPYRFERMPDLASYEEWGLWTVRDLPKLIRTDFVLQIQFDSWITSPHCWQDEFLSYDYIGPPWGWFKDNWNVGCGGFTLYSLPLMNFIAENLENYPVHPPYDVAICRTNRQAYENAGFKWASPETSLDFGFERTGFRGVDYHFGFHGMFNWPKVLDRPRLVQRINVCKSYQAEKKDALPELLDILGDYHCSEIGAELANLRSTQLLRSAS